MSTNTTNTTGSAPAHSSSDEPLGEVSGYGGSQENSYLDGAGGGQENEYPEEPEGSTGGDEPEETTGGEAGEE